MLNKQMVLCCGLALQAVCGVQASALADELPTQPVVQVNIPAHLDDLINKAMQPVLNTAQVRDEGDAWQLFRRLRPAIRDALGAKGYFSPVISRIAPPPQAQGEQALALRIVVDLGPQAVVSALDIQFEGDILLPEFANRRAHLLSQWGLGTGQPFDQDAWARSKDDVLRDLLANDFAAATLAQSEALVDPEANTVALRLVYDSGPVFTFGELQIDGLKKFKPDLVQRYNTIEPGTPYAQERVLELQAELQGARYFSSVDVAVDVDDQTPKQVPIHVHLVEGDSKRLSAGAGYSSNTGFRTEAAYEWNNLFDRAYALSTAARLEQKRQSAYADVYLPPSRKGVVDSLGIAVDHQAVSNLEVDRTSLGAVRQYTQGLTDVRLGLNFQLENRSTQGVDFGGTQALVGSMAWTRNRVDDRLNPRAGYIAFTQVAAASEALASNQDFVRLYGKWQHFWSPSKPHVVSSRVELGTVLSSAQRDIPQDYLFRAGGSNSIRGFDFLDLGVRDQGVLVGGRRLFIGSLEYTRWLENNIGLAVFSDAGNVADHWRDAGPKVALGTGVRYKTPAGSIAFDVAKALSEEKIRMHFALGLAF